MPLCTYLLMNVYLWKPQNCSKLENSLPYQNKKKQNGLHVTMKRRRLVFLVFITSFVKFWSQVCVLGSESQYFSFRPEAFVPQKRDIAFGALLPLHFKDKLGKCGSPKHQEGFLWLNALEYAVNEVNAKWNRQLYNASLTLKVRDTCNDGQIALEQALDLANSYRKNTELSSSTEENAVGDDLKPVLGVISASQNKDASTLLGLFKVPQIIFGRDGALRESASNDILQSVSVGFYKARALADLIKYFNWSALSVVYSANNQDDYKTFLRIANIEKLCIAVTVQLSTKKVETTRFGNAMEKLLSEPQTTVVVLFTSDAETKELFQSVKNKANNIPQFTWILANQQNLNCLRVDPVPSHNTLVLVSQFPFMEAFRNYFNNKDDIAEFNNIVETPDVQNSCSNIGSFDLPAERRKEEIQASMNSVYLLAHAYEKAAQTRSEQLDRAVFSRSLGQVLDVLFSQDWKMFSGQRRMKENMFSLFHLQSNESVNSLVNIGTWDRSWYINNFGLKWSNQTSSKSFCGAQCSPGHIRVLKDDCKCCWSCSVCHYNQIVQDDFTCVDCLRGYWPNEDFTKCEFQWRRTLFDCTLAVLAVVLVFSFMVL